MSIKYANLLVLIIRPLFFLTLFMVTVLSLWPGSAHPPTSPWSDKLGHALAYFVLGLQWQLGWHGSVRSRLAGLGFLLLYSAGMELFQGLAIIGRTTSVADMIANGSGLLLSAGFALVLRFTWPGSFSKKKY